MGLRGQARYGGRLQEGLGVQRAKRLQEEEARLRGVRMGRSRNHGGGRREDQGNKLLREDQIRDRMEGLRRVAVGGPTGTEQSERWKAKEPEEEPREYVESTKPESVEAPKDAENRAPADEKTIPTLATPSGGKQKKQHSKQKQPSRSGK